MGRPKRKSETTSVTPESNLLLRSRASRDMTLLKIRMLDTLAKEARTDVEKQPSFMARYLSLDKYADQFEAQQQEVLNIMLDLGQQDEFNDIDLLITMEVEDLCGHIRMIAELVRLAASTTDRMPLQNGSGFAGTTMSLPKIELPKFDGDVIQWCYFRDMFRSLVHENKSISNIERYHYLISCLSGPALTVVKSVPLTSDNYDIAWKALHDCYENPRLLATAHLDKLFSFSPLKTESAMSLSAFLNTFRENVAAITALGIQDISGFLLFYMGARVLDAETRRLYEASISQTAIPNLDGLLNFVSERCKILDNINICSDKPERLDKISKKVKNVKSGKSSFATLASPKSSKCLCCQHDHMLYRCFVFKRKPVLDRRKFVTDKSLCFICLASGHTANKCTTTYTCRKCEGRHNTMLHLPSESADASEKSGNAIVNTEKTSQNSTGSSASFSGNLSAETTVVLGTAVIRVQDDAGLLHPIRVLLDNGSQVSAMTLSCATKLGLKRHKNRTDVYALSQQLITRLKGVTQCDFIPSLSEYPRFNVTNVVVISQITSLMPSQPLPDAVRRRYGHLQLADPNFDCPGPIDMLIGCDVYPMLLFSKAEIINSPGLPSAMHTHLGWVINGPLQDVTPSSSTLLTITSTPPVEEMLQQFWTVEEPGSPAIKTTEDELCENWFQKTVSRDLTGRFVVALPFRTRINLPAEVEVPETGSVKLGSSRTMALNRLYNLERRLMKDPELYSAYKQFMNEYLSLGHMQPASIPGKYFIPHHAVAKRNNGKLKIRVVFDASAKTSTGYSLNDCLVTGPKLQLDISDVLLRSRFHKYLFVADIEKMYRQINICAEDRAYQHILWRDTPNEEVREFQLCTITYGVNAAPFLAIRCLHQLNQDDGSLFPLANNILTTSTYVDDIIAGADTVEEIVQLKEQVVSLLRRGNFSLKKWASNCPSVLMNIQEEDRAQDSCFDAKDDQSVKILGLHWNTKSDIFGYHTSVKEGNTTKRSILSTIARLYDPIGAIGPTIFWAKCIIQELWIQKLHWDAPPPTQLVDKWKTFTSEFNTLSQVMLTRHIDIRLSKHVELIGFADASQKGYAATVYLRVVDQSNVVKVHFIACKTKVAPLKRSNIDTLLTIPRLELCAALLLARLISHQYTVLQNFARIDRIRAWTDSTIVLSWLHADQKQFKIFVTNRVAKIKALTPTCEWAHVGTSDNPADPASRGLLPDALVTCSLFLHGPTFLHYPECQWPIVTTSSINPEELPDYKRPSKNVLLTQQIDSSLIQRFSVLRKMQRVLAYCLRFADRARQRTVVSGPITWQEYERVLMKVTMYTQRLYYSDLYHQLVTSNSIVTPSSLAQLAPFVDDHGIIRVGGRLQHSDLSTDAKHPILLSKSSHLAQLIVHHYHHNTLHGGTRLVASLIQRRFWIVSIRAAIRQIISKCTVCIRYRAAAPQPFMADLPSTRVQQCRPFANVGMDYGGPFTIKESQRRNSKTHKAYLGLFVCLSTKAVHLEVVTDLTTEAFLASFDRFVARRGIPVQIYSDCGTNYVGAAKQLKTLFHDAATKEALHARVPCQWRFNPPAAPHFGGIWEAAIKSTKLHLKKVVGNQVYTLEELMTLITRIEGVLNSRPLVAMSTDPNDLSVLTPGHFLIGQPILAIPEHDISDIPQNRLKRWQLVRQAFQSFWKRWSREYLHTLQSRQKWFHQNPSLGVGDVVVINSPSRPPLMWQLGRVIDVHPGADQVVRVATIKTAEGILKRPVVKLVKLPTDNA
uniref:Integrase catalytic domain-containing protein n=1 Tax=Schizaphis graminum TaxID=13262 RepID=A0A2S2P1X6_SCHGA